MAVEVFSQNGEVLENGAKWMTIERNHTETVALELFIRGGLFRETKADNGIGTLFAHVWLKSGPMLEEVEYLGGNVSAGASHDFFRIGFAIPTEYLDRIILAFEKQLLKPKFDPEIFKREKDLTLRSIEAEKDEPNIIAMQKFFEATYPDHPYALKSDGDIESVNKLLLKDIEDYYRKHINGADVAAVLAGKFTKEQSARLKKITADLPKGTPFKVLCQDAAIANDTRSEAFDTRIQQSKLFYAFTAPSTADKDYPAVKLLNELLGGGMSSMYFKALRKERGFAYEVSSVYPSRLCSSRLVGYIGLMPENEVEAVSVMRGIHANIAKTITDAEIERGKNMILGDILQETETNNRTAWYTAFFLNLGFGVNHLESYINEIKNIRRDDLERVSKIFNGPSTLFLYKPVDKNIE
jgi:predicted Zn-dependent peptidase